MHQIGMYYYDLLLVTNKHSKYIREHPEAIGTYNYREGIPQTPHFNIE